MAEQKITGYHGTIKASAEKILKEQRFNASRKPNEWLGCGVYFFPHYAEAQWWAEIRARQKKMSQTVLKADLICEEEEFLDLDLFDRAQDVNQTFYNFLDRLKQEGQLIPEFNSKEDKRRCFAVELYKKLHTEIKLIAYTFDAPVGDKRKDQFVFVPRQRQLCVCDPAIIRNIESV